MEDASQWWVLLRTLASLAFVIASIFAVAWVAKKFWRPERWNMGVTGGMRIVHTIAIGPKKKLSIVEVEGRRLLLGVAEAQVNLVADLSNAGERARIPSQEIEYVKEV